jgi:hypothetical protein
MNWSRESGGWLTAKIGGLAVFLTALPGLAGVGGRMISTTQPPPGVRGSRSPGCASGTIGADEAIFRKPRNSPETEQGLACRLMRKHKGRVP